MSRKLANLVDVFNVERDGPSYGDASYSLTFWGKTPGGKDLTVKVQLPSWGVHAIADRLHEIVREQQRLLDEAKASLQGERA
ncbi:MAG: hypothetical protein JWQ87_2218 [Candidatus Sulfotelmatobacter sp.]|nr:hypothetical protein [Candidatus Sulfotelmatobacter sp.]